MNKELEEKIRHYDNMAEAIGSMMVDDVRRGDYRLTSVKRSGNIILVSFESDEITASVPADKPWYVHFECNGGNSYCVYRIAKVNEFDEYMKRRYKAYRNAVSCECETNKTKTL